MPGLFRTLPIAMLLLLFTFSPVRADSNCAVNVDNLNYPSSVYAGSNFDVIATVTVTCQKAGNYLSGSASLVDSTSNAQLDSRTFILGFIPPFTPSSITSSVSLTARNAPTTGQWNLRLVIEVYGYASQGIITSTQRDFAVQIIQSQNQTPTTDLPILQNGGFESGLTGWEQIQGLGGFVTLSNRIVHSGGTAAAIGIAPPRPGTNPLSPIIEGISQSQTVASLRGLRVEAWYFLQANTYLLTTRMRVEVGGLTLNYYASVSPYTSLPDTTKMKSILLSPQDCAPWCFLQADVGSDVRSYFNSPAFASIFQGNQSEQVTIALEFLVSGGSDSQFIYWDDIAVVASTPSQTTTTTAFISSTSTTSSTTSFTSQPLLITEISTSTEAVGFVITNEQLYLELALALGVALVIITLLYVRVKRGAGKH